MARRSSDEYAKHVALELRGAGLSASEAVDLVQRSEAEVRRSYAAGMAASSMAERLSGRARAMASPKTASDAAGCPYVPIEAFFLDVDELPRLDACYRFDDGLVGRPRAIDGLAEPSYDYFLGRRMQKMAYELLSETIFGRVVTLGEIESTYSAEADGLYQVARVSNLIMEPRKARMTVDMVVDTGSKVYGHLTRVFQRTERGLSVFHELYVIDGKETQQNNGRGLGTLITRKSFLWYRRLGVHEVTTKTAWVGRYVWAGFGFDWKLSDRKSIGRRLWSYLGDRRGDVELRGSFLDQDRRTIFDLSASEPKAKAAIVSGRLTTHSWNTASLRLELRQGVKPFFGVYRKPNEDPRFDPVGKRFLMGETSKKGKFVKVRGRLEDGLEGGWYGAVLMREGSPSWKQAKWRLGIE